MKNFNIIISGVGGQGIITLLKVIADSAVSEGFDFKSSELHGLSQRGGSVKTHIRIGKKVNSPLIMPGQADFILGLEPQEGLRNRMFANNKTVFLINKQIIPTRGENIEKQQIEGYLKKNSPNTYIVDANEITKKELNSSLVSGIFLLAYASFNKFIPISINSIKKSVKKIVKPKYVNLNLKTIDLVKKFSN